MQKIKFTKMVASGNDFVVVEKGHKSAVRSQEFFAIKVCDRKFGIGADGLLVLEKSRTADIRMRIFNADGSEAEMCGNGARCVALYISKMQNPEQKTENKINIETKAGNIKSELKADNIKIRLTDPKDIKLDIPLKINNRLLKVNFVNTGVPHTVIFVEGLDKIDVVNWGRGIRYHKKFQPAGTNVDFVEVLNNNRIKIRTYERGVEEETLACGTGAAASSIILKIKNHSLSVKQEKSKITKQCKIDVETKSKEVLKVYFNNDNSGVGDVWLEGKAEIVYTGLYYVKFASQIFRRR